MVVKPGTEFGAKISLQANLDPMKVAGIRCVLNTTMSTPFPRSRPMLYTNGNKGCAWFYKPNRIETQ